MKPYLLTLLITLCGCGARVTETRVESDDAASAAADSMGPASSDTGAGGAIVSDAGGTIVDATPVEDASTPEPKPTDGPQITSLSACPSAAGVDKIIASTSEGIRFAASAISVTPGGTTCPEVYPGTGSETAYSFSAKCGTVDKTKPINVVVRSGVVGVSGKEMAPGTYTFVPTGKGGRVCGDDFQPATL